MTPGHAIPSPRLAYLPCVQSADEPALRHALVLRQFALLDFDGREVLDGATLCAQVSRQLTDKLGLPARGWDSLRDALFEAATRAAASNVALLWRDADALAGADLQDLLMAANILHGLAIDLRRHRQIEFHAFLLGTGAAYRPAAAVLGQ